MGASETTIISPHLDDAVLSCWHLLEGDGELGVINVFAASPRPGMESPWWDKLSGAIDPASRMRERHAEDRKALGLVGRAAVSLDFLDEQYRDADQAVEPIVEALRAVIPTQPVVYAPAALGFTRDHAIVRAAALELWRSGADLRLYADLPHASRLGWPSWLNGAAPNLDVDSTWEQRLAETGVDPGLLAPDAHELSAETRERKLRAVRCYATQVHALETTFGPITERVLPYEITWKLPAPTAAPKTEPSQAAKP